MLTMGRISVKRMEAYLCPGHAAGKLAYMADTDSTPADEYAEEPEVPREIPLEEPEADVLEQRQEVPVDEDEDEPWRDEAAAEAGPDDKDAR
jgi:hypothetical protein